MDQKALATALSLKHENASSLHKDCINVVLEYMVGPVNRDQHGWHVVCSRCELKHMIYKCPHSKLNAILKKYNHGHQKILAAPLTARHVQEIWRNGRHFAGAYKFIMKAIFIVWTKMRNVNTIVKVMDILFGWLCVSGLMPWLVEPEEDDFDESMTKLIRKTTVYKLK